VKRILPYLFLTVTLVYVFSQVVIFVDYTINKEYIAENLCENKDKPEMQCNGMCHLKKELIKDEERKTDEPKAPVVIQLVLFSTTEAISICTAPEIDEAHSSCTCLYLKNTLIGYEKGVFHPPTQIV